jgi:transposase
VASRYELSEVQWERIKDRLPGRVEHVGRTAADNRQFVNAVLWVLRTGARWHDLPERYGKYKSVHARFMRWARSGVWERIFADLVADKKNRYPDDRLDHRPSASAGGGRPQKRGSEDPALGRSRGGLSTKIHLLADEAGLPVDFRITPGQAAEYAQDISLLEGREAEAVIADRGYDSAEIVAKVESLGAVAVIPPRRHRKQPRSYDRELYKGVSSIHNWSFLGLVLL